jgi:hypothetical protein
MENQNSLCTFEELLERRDTKYHTPSRIANISESVTRPGVHIIIFWDGTQANVDNETLKQINIYEYNSR